MTTSSGRVSIVIGGVPYSARGEVTLSGSNITVAAAANSDGTPYRTVSAKVRSSTLTFDKGSVLTAPDGTTMKWDESMMKVVGLPVTFTEDDVGGKQHLFSGAFFTGDPEQNLSTGEISNLGIAATGYTSV
jgi:hypothetical protein